MSAKQALRVPLTRLRSLNAPIGRILKLIILHALFWRIALPAAQRRDTDKLSPLLKLRYRSAMADALSDLGSAAQIRQVFVGFQRYLYQG
jgi:hypothetical protein